MYGFEFASLGVIFWGTFAAKCSLKVCKSTHSCHNQICYLVSYLTPILKIPSSTLWCEVHWTALWERQMHFWCFVCKKWRLPMVHFAIIKIVCKWCMDLCAIPFFLYLCVYTSLQNPIGLPDAPWLVSHIACDPDFLRKIKDFKQK